MTTPLTPEAATILSILHRKGPQPLRHLMPYADRADRAIAELRGLDLISSTRPAVEGGQPVYAAIGAPARPGLHYCPALDASVSPQTCSSRVRASRKPVQRIADLDLSLDACARCAVDRPYIERHATGGRGVSSRRDRSGGSVSPCVEHVELPADPWIKETA